MIPEIKEVTPKILEMPLKQGDVRRVVAIAGAPGSGKSTFAEALSQHLRAQAIAVKTVPMDGFHLDNSILCAQGSLERKGAPHTFDAMGCLALLQRLKVEHDVVYPLFDRSLDLAIAGAGRVDAGTDIVLMEGNYLLSQDAPWLHMARLFDLSIYLNVPHGVLRSRLIQRWLDHGLDQGAAIARVEGNDLPNAQYVMRSARDADISVSDYSKC